RADTECIQLGPQDKRQRRSKFSQALLLLAAPGACEIDPVANTHLQPKTLALSQGSVRPAHPKSPRALPRQDGPTGYSRGLRGSYFLFPIREFQLVTVSLIDCECVI